MMIRRLTTIFLLAALLMLGQAALAQSVPEIHMTVSSRCPGVGEQVTVTITVINPSDEDMDGPMALYGPDGRRIEGFGTPTLRAGQAAGWEEKCTVTSDMLEAGRIVYAIAYTVKDANGNLALKKRSFYTEISSISDTQAPELIVTAEFDRTELPAFPGVVKAVILVTNAGSTELRNVKISASGVTLYTISVLQPGTTMTIQRDIQASMPGSFRFDASVQDARGETTVFQSNVIRVVQAAAPTAAPELPADGASAEAAGPSSLPVMLLQLLIWLLRGL